MDTKERKCRLTKAQKEAIDQFPGVAINKADNCSDTEKLRDERTETLNNNPRNEDM